MRSCPLVIAGLLALALATPARAALIIGNLPGNDGFTSAIGQVGSIGAGFTMTSSFALTSATLRLNVPSGQTPTVLVMSDTGGSPPNPSTTLFTFTDPAFGSGTQNYVFTPPLPFTLTAGTTYWLVIEGNAATLGTLWLGNRPLLTPTGTGATSAGGRFSDTGFPPTNIESLVNSYEIDGTPVTAVPVPPTLLLGLVGLGAGGVARLRRRMIGRVGLVSEWYQNG
jgi:hypothetical protein